MGIINNHRHNYEVDVTDTSIHSHKEWGELGDSTHRDCLERREWIAKGKHLQLKRYQLGFRIMMCICGATSVCKPPKDGEEEGINSEGLDASGRV